MSNPDCKHNPSRRDRFTIVELERKSAGRALETYHQLVFQFRHHAVAKGKSVSREGIKADRDASVGIINPPLGAKSFQRKLVRWIVYVRRETVRLEQHAFGHVR